MKNEKSARYPALFLISQSITLFGSTLVQMAIVWYVALETTSGVWVSAFTVCAYLPQFLISFLGGALADRFNKKLLIILSDCTIALATLVLFFLMPYMSGNTMLGIILLVTIIRSIGAGIQTPAVNAAIPLLVAEDKYMRYNGLNATMQSIVQFAAPAVAGVVLTFAALKWVFLIDIATAVIGTVILCFVSFPKQERVTENVSLFADMKKGLRYSFSDKLLRTLLLTFGLFIFLCVPAGFLASLFVARTYGDTYWYLTAVEVVGFVGMMLGGIIMTAWGGFKKRTTTLFVGVLCFGLLAIGMGAIPNFYAYLALMLLYGIALTMVQTATTTMIQEQAEASMQGSVFGVMSAFYSGFLPVGMAVFGPLSDVVDLRYVMIGSGVLLAIMAVFIILSKSLKCKKPEITEQAEPKE